MAATWLTGNLLGQISYGARLPVQKVMQEHTFSAKGINLPVNFLVEKCH